MARERKVSEKAVKNMIAFLEELKEYSGSTGGFSVTGLAKVHHVSQTAATTVKQLGIIRMVEESRNWIYTAKDPDRKLALIVLDSQLQKNKPGAYTPLFPDMAKIEALLQEISNKLDNVSQIENNPAQGFILSEEEKRFKILLAITQGYYSNPGIGHLNHVERNSSDIIEATEDLLKQYNEKFKN